MRNSCGVRAVILCAWCLGILTLIAPVAFGQVEDTSSVLEQLGGDGYREGQYPGLGRAASEIFYADRPITLSGYAELANVSTLGGPRDYTSEDLELYYNQLYRLVPFIGVRITKNWFWTTELGMEYLEGNGESEYHFFPETYTDIILKQWLSVRAGLQPLNIGYINNNEEPLLYLSVNRPETERLIIPTEWIEMGMALYGELGPKFSYFAVLTNGIDAAEFNAPTWIRAGAQERIYGWEALAGNFQINYLPDEKVTLSLSTYLTNSGRNQTILVDEATREVRAPLQVLSGYARYDQGGFSLIAMGAMGSLEESRDVYFLTLQEKGEGEVIGAETYGFYVEPSFDLLHLFGKNNGETRDTDGWFHLDHPQLPVFLRYERLDTHAAIDPELKDLEFARSNIYVMMAGINYLPNHNLAIKFDVRYKENFSRVQNAPASEILYEFGLGIEF